MKETAAKSPASSDNARKATAGTYSLQLGAFTTRAAAQAMVSKVRAKDTGYPVSTHTLSDTAITARFRVMVGPYSTLDEANRVMTRLKKDGFDAYLKR